MGKLKNKLIERSLATDPKDLSGQSVLLAPLVIDGFDDWEKSHEIQVGSTTPGNDAARISCLSPWKEGDQWNADYGYKKRAGEKRPEIYLRLKRMGRCSRRFYLES